MEVSEGLVCISSEVRLFFSYDTMIAPPLPAALCHFETAQSWFHLGLKNLDRD